MKYALTLPLLLAAAPVLATGFTPSTLAGAAHKADATQIQLQGETEQLRLALAYDTALGLGTRTEAERTALLRTLQTGEGAGDLRVQWFMAGAIAQSSKGATTILYNPLARGTLALDWAKNADGWHVTRAWLSSSGPAQWPASTDPWRKAFAADYVTARAYEGDAGRDWIAFESDRWLGSLALALNNPAKRTGIESGAKLIAAGRTAKVGGENIDLLPASARAAYHPIAAIARKDGGLAVIYGTPLLPQMLIAGDFSVEGTIEKLSLMNLGNIGEAK